MAAEDCKKIYACSIDLWYNRPKLSSCALWNPNATTFANKSTIDRYPHGIFVSKSNTVYTSAWDKSWVRVWHDGNSTPIRTISEGLGHPFSLFVARNGDIYVDNGEKNRRVDKWTENATKGIMVMNISVPCRGLFIDTNDTLYCALKDAHRVVKTSLITTVMTPITVAGTGLNGSTSDMLDEPWGIVVDVDFTLYVADHKNNRIQRFHLGEKNGTTVVGSTAPISFSLNHPIGVILDADGYLFIIDSDNHRIVGSTSAGFRCVAGCSCASGSTADKLWIPRHLAFDSIGNLFVADDRNNRIQKFLLISNFCNETTTLLQQSTTYSDNTVRISTDDVQSRFASTSIPTTSLSTTTFHLTPISSLISFVPSSPCQNTADFGWNCNYSSTVCDTLKPCHNNGTCNNTTGDQGFNCSCPLGFVGDRCEVDDEPCKENICWNEGKCTKTSTNGFSCACLFGWEGDHCERKTNYCFNITCRNKGVCRPLLGKYLCECLGDSYSGRHCEIVATKILIYRIVSKSFAYVAIIAMVLVATFVIVMDILKYCFGIDPTREERQRYRQERRARRRKPVIQRFVYVNASPETAV